ncbi:MAG: hypothetical protein KJ600_03475 [Nanoarchaeota archaeon]|nr:hypothetical protein [Nanoarchaeota archaeon]MBU1103588.1 hypothetical protein [Nanoarchaeota archaeon]
MIFRKKEEEEKLPDLPPLPGSSMRAKFGGSEYDDDNEKSALPKFPDSPSHNQFSRVAIKEAVEDKEPEEIIGHESRDVNVIEMDEWHPVNPLKHRELEHHEVEEIEEDEPVEQRYVVEPPRTNVQTARPADIFVRIDKFHSARKTLREISERLEEIDEVVQKIRETKLREEQELASWEKDLAHIKGRIKIVSESIFEKVE